MKQRAGSIFRLTEKWILLVAFSALFLAGCGGQTPEVAGEDAATPTPAAEADNDTATSPPSDEVTDGDAAPAFVATGIDGRQVDFPASANGNPSVLFMWATWCPYCKVLMPRLNDIRGEYAERGVEVLAINAKERGRGDPVAYMKEAGWDFLTIVDEGDQIAEYYDVEYLPGLFVVDGEGTVVFRRKWTELAAGQEVADLWETQVRSALEDIFRG